MSEVQLRLVWSNDAPIGQEFSEGQKVRVGGREGEFTVAFQDRDQVFIDEFPKPAPMHMVSPA